MTGRCTCPLIESAREEILSRLRRDRQGVSGGVRTLLEVIESHLWDPAFGAQQLRQVGRLDSDTLWSFQELFGCSVSAYVDQWRLEAACRAVRGSDAPISDIAMALGFQGPAHFTKWLKRRIGLAPSRLRGAATRAAATSGEPGGGADGRTCVRPSRGSRTHPGLWRLGMDASRSATLVLTPVVGRQALVKALEPMGLAALMGFLRLHYPDAFRPAVPSPPDQACQRQTRGCP